MDYLQCRGYAEKSGMRCRPQVHKLRQTSSLAFLSSHVPDSEDLNNTVFTMKDLDCSYPCFCVSTKTATTLFVNTIYVRAELSISSWQTNFLCRNAPFVDFALFTKFYKLRLQSVCLEILAITDNYDYTLYTTYDCT